MTPSSTTRLDSPREIEIQKLRSNLVPELERLCFNAMVPAAIMADVRSKLAEYLKHDGLVHEHMGGYIRLEGIPRVDSDV